MILDLRKGFGKFEDYELYKFPDNSIKFVDKDVNIPYTQIRTTIRSVEDIWTLGLIKDVLEREGKHLPPLRIDYLFTQQDDRIFNEKESFGLKITLGFLNSLGFPEIEIFHPHNADPVEMGLNNCVVIPNDDFVMKVIMDIQDSMGHDDAPVWVIPDAGAFKTQFKQVQKIGYPKFITCMKSRAHTGEIETVVNTEDLQGQDCFIIDDIALGSRTHINIAKELKLKNCGKLYLIVSHGVFNYGIDHILEHFETIYTTDSICTIPESDRLKIFKL